jgi:hypothetical protein
LGELVGEDFPPVCLVSEHRDKLWNRRLTVLMSSPVKLVAEALAYRWGELQETPPEFIGDLMIELTTALEAAHRSGEEERAECLDEVLDLLAEGIYKYEHRAGEEVEEERLDRAITEIRTYLLFEKWHSKD